FHISSFASKSVAAHGFFIDFPLLLMNPARFFGLIPAAGIGARMGSALPKQYIQIADQPMLMHALAAFTRTPLIAHTFVVVSADDGYIDGALAASTWTAHAELSVLRVGGATR